jgi:hypothetical protein
MFKPDETKFPNQLPHRLDNELNLASDLGVNPIKGGDPEFDEIVNAGTIKWAVTLQAELVIIPKYVGPNEIAHTVLTNGLPVLAAGEAEITAAAGTYWGLEINNHSGHFKASLESLEIGKELFEKIEIIFS